MILPPSQNHLKLSSTNTVASGVDVNVMCTHPSQNQQLSDILQPVDRENEWKLDSKRTISIESIRNESGHGNSGCTNGIIFNNGVSKDVNEIQRTQVQMQKNPAHQSQNGHQQLTHHFNSMNGGKSNGPNHLDINDHGSSKASSTSISVDSSNGGRIKTRTSNAPLPSRNSSCQSITEISSMPQSQSQLQSHIQMQLKQKLDFNHQFDTTLQSEPSTNGTIKTSSSCNDDIPNVQAGNTDASASGHTATTLLGITQMKDLKKQFRIQAERGRRNSSERIAIPTGMMTMMAKENNSGVDYAIGMAERGRRNSSERIAVSTEMMTMMAKGSNAGVGSSMRLLQAMDMQQQNQQQHRMRTQQQRIQMGMMTNDKDLPSEMLGSGQTTKRPWNGAMLPIGNVIATTSNNPTANISRGTSRSRLRLSKPSSMMMKMYENVSVTPPVPGENERRSMTNNDANSISDNNETIKAQLRNNIPPQPSSSSSSSDFSSPTKSHKTNWVASSIGLASSSSRRSLGSLDRNVFAVNPANDRVKVARSLGSFGSHRRSHSSIFKNPPKSMDDVLLSKWNAFSSNADWSVKIQPGNERMRQHQSCFSISHQPTRNPALQYAVLKSVEQYQYADDEASDVAVIGKQIRSNQGHDLSLDRKPSTINISKTSLPWGTLVESDTMTSSLLQPERKTSGLSVPKTSGKCHLNSGCSHDKVVNEAIDDAFELGVEHEFSNARDEFTGLDVKSESRINIEKSLKGPMVARALQNGDGEDITGLEDKTSDCLTGTVRYGIDGSKQRPLKNGRKSPPMMTTTRLSRFTITENSDEIMPNAGWERDDFLTSYQDAELHCGFSQSSSSSSQRKQAHLGSLLIPSGHIEDSAWNEVLVEEEEATGCSNSNSGSSVSKKQLGHVSSKVIQCLDRKPSSVYLKQADDNMTLNASMLSTDCEPANTFTPFERRLSGLSVSGNSEMFLDSSAYGQYDIHCELPFEHAGVSCDVQGTGKKTVDVSSMPSKNGRQEVAGSAQSDIIKDMSRCLSNDDAGTNLPSNQLHSPSRQNQHENASMNNLNPLLANHMKLSSCRKASHPNLQSSGCSPPSNEFRQGVNSHRMASLSRPSLTNLVRWSSLLGKKSNADLQNSEWSVESCSKSRSSFASLVKKPSAMSRKTSKGNLQNETFSDNYEQPHHPIANASRPSLTSLLRKPSLLRGLKSSNNLQNATFELSTSSKKNGDIEQSQSRSTAGGEMTRTSSLNLIRKPLKKDSSAKRLVSLMRTNHDSDHGHGVSQKHHIPSPHGGLNRGNAGGDSFRRSCTVTHRCSSLCNDGDYEPAKLVDDIKRSGCCLPKLVAKIPTSSSFSRNAFGMKCYEKNEEWTDQQIDYHFEKALLEAKSALGVAIPPKGHRSSSRIGKSVPSRSLRRNLSEQFRNPGHDKKTDYTSTRSMHRSASQNFVGSEKFDSFRRPVRRHTSDITLGEDYPEKYARRRSFLLHRGSNNGPSPPISRRSSMNYDGEKNHRRSNINNNDKKVRRAFNLISRKKSIIRHSSAISTAAVVLMKRRASVESMNSSHTSQELEAVETFDLEDVFTELLRYDEECKKSKEARNGIFDWDKTRKALSANSDKKLRWKDFSHNNQAADSKKGNIFHLLCKHRPPHDILEQLLVFVHKSEMDNSLSKSRKHPREENRDHPSRTFLPPSHTPPGMQAKNPAKRTTWAEVLETRDENDRTPLHVAAASGCSLEALRALIHAHPPVASMTDRQGRSPLILAIMWYFDPTSLNIEEIDMTLRYSMELATLLEIIRIFKSTMTLHPGAAGVMDVDEFGLASFDYAIKGEASDEIIESLKSDDFHINRNQVNEDKGEDDDTPKKAAERRLSDKFYDEMDVQTTDKLNVDLSFSEDILEPWETESFEQAKQLLELAADKEYAEIEQFVELPPVEEISIIRLQDRVRRRFSESSLLSTFFRAVNHHTFGDDISEITLPAVLSYGID